MRPIFHKFLRKFNHRFRHLLALVGMSYVLSLAERETTAGNVQSDGGRLHGPQEGYIDESDLGPPSR